MVTSKVICVFVVLAVPQVSAKQEKIKTKFSLSNSIFSDSDFFTSEFDYSTIFAFNPFTPFPELRTTTQKPETISGTPKDAKIVQTTSTRKQAEKPTSKKSSILRKRAKKVAGKPKRKWKATGKAKFTSIEPDSLTDQLAVTEGYSTAGKYGYKVISDSSRHSTPTVSKSDRKTTEISNKDWIQSILSRTTRRPKTTTRPPPTTTTPSPTTTKPAPVLTRELQLQLRKLLARKHVPEQSRSSGRFVPPQSATTRGGQQQYPAGRQAAAPQQYTPARQRVPNNYYSRQTNEKVHNFQAQQIHSNQQFESTKDFTSQQQNAPNQKTSYVTQLEQAILSQQQSHQKFLKKKKFRLRQSKPPPPQQSSKNSDKQYSQQEFASQQQFSRNNLFSPKQQFVSPPQSFQQKQVFNNPQQKYQLSHNSQFSPQYQDYPSSPYQQQFVQKNYNKVERTPRRRF